MGDLVVRPLSAPEGVLLLAPGAGWGGNIPDGVFHGHTVTRMPVGTLIEDPDVLGLVTGFQAWDGCGLELARAAHARHVPSLVVCSTDAECDRAYSAGFETSHEPLRHDRFESWIRRYRLDLAWLSARVLLTSGKLRMNETDIRLARLAVAGLSAEASAARLGMDVTTRRRRVSRILARLASTYDVRIPTLDWLGERILNGTFSP